MTRLNGKEWVLLVIFSLIVWAFLGSCGGSGSDKDSDDTSDSSTTEDYSPTPDDYENIDSQVMAASLVTNTATTAYSSAQEDLSSAVFGVAVTNDNTRAIGNEKELYNKGGCQVFMLFSGFRNLENC